MIPKFTTPCFIRKNTPEIRKKLEDLGYDVLFSARNGLGRWLVTTECGFVHTMHTDIDRFIDCGENEQLFLALAALREDSEYMQWFCDLKQNNFTLCLDENNPKHLSRGSRGMNTEFGILHKATPAELIGHFK